MRDLFDNPQFYCIPAGTESVSKFLEFVEGKTISNEWERLSKIVNFSHVINETFKNMTEEEYYTMYTLLGNK